MRSGERPAHLLLDHLGCVDGLRCGAEGRHDAITAGLDDASAVTSDELAQGALVADEEPIGGVLADPRP